MIKNYIIIALRNILRHKLYSLINVGGLAIGMASCIAIFLFVQDELSYDKWITDADKIYRMETEYLNPSTKMAISPGRLRDPLVDAHADKIDAFSRLYWEGGTITVQDKGNGNEVKFFDSIYYVDADFFKIFDLKMVSGDRTRLFDGLNNIILTETMAKKYFGEQKAVGQTLDINDGEKTLTVVAVSKDLPENSSMDIEFLAYFDPDGYPDQPWIAQLWTSANVHSFIKFKESGDAALLEQSLPGFLDKNVPERNGGKLPSEILKLTLMPVQDIHLHSVGKFQLKPTGSILMVYGFSAIALLILFIASTNFMNLSTARASLRAKEIALRKVMGAARQQLILQFLGEALLMTLIALMVALGIVELILPWYNELIDKQLAFQALYNAEMGAMILLMVSVVTFGAGLYPALVLSSFRPGKILHGGKANSGSSSKLRSGLVVMQFAISIGLIIMTSIVYEQINFARTKDLGFNMTHKLILHLMSFPEVKDVAQTMRQEIEKIPGVKISAFSNRSLPLTGYWDQNVVRSDAPEGTSLAIEMVPSDFNFLELYQAKLLAGRLFSEDRRGDLAKDAVENVSDASATVVITRKAVASLGFANPEQAIGKTFKMGGATPRESKTITTIVGVVEDMFLRSLRDRIDPLIFVLATKNLNTLHLEISGENIDATLAEIDRIWAQLVPDLSIRRSFVDERFARMYLADQKRGEIFAYFAILAVLVSCLGLYGLAAFTAEQRTKEIGIRKVLGASLMDIVKLLVWQFSKPVLLANLLAWPVAYYFMRDYLNGFEHRIGIQPEYFIIASIAALIIAWATITWHAVRVATAKPIEALRYE